MNKRAFVVGVLALVACAATLYFHGVVGTDIIFAHLYYLPIILAAIGWERRSWFLTAFMGAFLLGSHVISGIEVSITSDLARATSFLLVGGVTAELSRAVRRAGEALQASYRHQAAILGSMLDAVVVANPDGTIRTVNRAALELLGYWEQELIGQPVGTIFEEEEEEEEEEAAFFRGTGLAQLVREGAARDVEMTLRTRSGERIPVVFNGSVIQEEDGRLAAVVGVARDIRERKRAEEERVKAVSAVVDAMGDALLLHTLDGRITFVNPAYEKITGYETSELVGKDVADVAPRTTKPEDAEKTMAAVETALKGKIPVPVPITLVSREGRETPAAFTVSFMEDAKGEPSSAVVVFKDITELRRAEAELKEYSERLEEMVEQRTDELEKANEQLQQDITERKRAEEVLKASEERYRSLFDDVPTGLYRTTPEGQIVDANPALVQMLGYPDREFLLAVNAADLYVDPEGRRRWQALVEREGGGSGLEVQWRRHDGMVIWVRDSAVAVRDANGWVLHYEGAVKDITERKRAEEKLRESEERFQQVAENAQEFIWEVDARGLYTYVSPVVEKMLGYRPEEVLGKKHFYDLFYPEDREELKQAAFEVFAQKQLFHEFVNRNVRKDSEAVWLSTSGIPILDGEGNLLGYRGADTDITDRKRAEEEIRQRTAQLEALRQVGLEITIELDLDTLLHSIVSRAIELIEGTAGGLYLYRPDRDVLEWSVPVGPHLASVGTVLQRGEGLAGKVWETSEPLIVDDYRHWEGRAASWEGYPVTAVVSVPVRWGEEFMGVLNVHTDTPSSFSPADAELLSLFATQAAIAIGNARQFEEAQRHLRELNLLFEVGRGVTSILDPDKVLQMIIESAIEAIPTAEKGSLHLLDEETGELVARASSGFSQELIETAHFKVGEGYAGWVFEHGEPAIIDNVHTDPRFKPIDLPEAAEEKSAICVPLVARDKTVGTLSLDNVTTYGAFDESDLGLLCTFANQAAIAIENARLYEAARQELAERKRAEEALELRVKQLATLSQASQAMTASLELGQLLAEIVPLAGEVVASDYASVVLVDEAGHLGQSAENLPGVLAIEYRIRDEGLTSWIVRSRQAVIIEEIGEDGAITSDLGGGAPRFANPLIVEAGVKSVAGLPLMVKGRLLGVLYIHSLRPGAFHGQLPLLTTFANQVTIAVENARLYEAVQRELTERKRAEEELQRTTETLRKTLGATIQAIALTVETRDPYTAGHQRRVAKLARAIATEMGLSREQSEGVRMATVIHDIGKITVPTDILNKPGRLSEHEFGIIKCHPKTGYDILKTVEFPWPIAQIIFQHHERMDGSGYPQALSGEEIILEARILAVADVVEAMASFRPYRPALGIDKALEEISQNRGVLYAPEVVDACLRLFTENGFTFE